VIAGVLLFGAGLFLIGDRRMLFNRTFNVTAEFANIAGLEEGAKVRVAGLDAGAVDTIHVPANPSARFRVELRIRQDLHPLIRVDSVATIQTDGLVGNKFVQVEAGTDQAATVPPGGTIRSREAFELSAMLQRMSDTVDLVNTTITDLKGGVEAALASISDTAKEAQDLMNDVGGDARAIMSSSQRVSENLSAIVSDVRQGKGTVGKLVTDDSLYTSAKSIAADAQKAVATLRDATEQARQAVVKESAGSVFRKRITRPRVRSFGRRWQSTRSGTRCSGSAPASDFWAVPRVSPAVTRPPSFCSRKRWHDTASLAIAPARRSICSLRPSRSGQ